MPDGSKVIASLDLQHSHDRLVWGAICAARDLGHEVSVAFSFTGSNEVVFSATWESRTDWKCPRCESVNRALSNDCSDCCCIRPEKGEVLCKRCGEAYRHHFDGYCRNATAGERFAAGTGYGEMDVHHEEDPIEANNNDWEEARGREGSRMRALQDEADKKL